MGRVHKGYKDTRKVGSKASQKGRGSYKSSGVKSKGDNTFSQHSNGSNVQRKRDFGGRHTGDPIQRSLKDVKELAVTAGMKWNFNQNSNNKYLGNKTKFKRVPVPKEQLLKHDRGEGLSGIGIKTKYHQKKLEAQEKVINFSIEQAARTEVLLPEDAGFLEADEGEDTAQITQRQIVENTDITSATKHFDLTLKDFGPYRINYSRNGRHLLLGGRKGHIAAFDWFTKKLACEINVMEETFDVQWLHNELMFAVAQKKWTYIYDNQGVELHCIKKLDNVLRMEFLPYHFLLATASERSFLSWLDVSMGKLVAQMHTHQGRLNVMTQNPYNALLCLGHSKGTVTMWTPNTNTPVVQMLCHKRPLQAIAIDSTGKYMATSCIDTSMRIWDIRNLNGPVQSYNLRGSATNLTFSQRSVLAASLTNVVETYRDCCTKATEKAYMRHVCRKPVANMQFCPNEDVLGVGTGDSFTSLIVPGSGEPNFDALECNPYETKKQRQEGEVKSLLEKIQPEFITLDPGTIAEVDVPTLQEKLDAKAKIMHMKVPNIDFTPRRNRRKGSVKAARAKKIVKEEGRREFVKNIKSIQQQQQASEDKLETNTRRSVLDRFRPKNKKV